MTIAEKQNMPLVHHNLTNDRMNDLVNEDELLNCMRCGFCLPACPTYRETGTEASSPRGRIALMKAAAEGRLADPQVLEKQLNQCLGCRACEPACPSGVKYGELLEQSRQAVEETFSKHRWWVGLLRKTFFNFLFLRQSRMRMLGSLIGLYQRSGLQWLVRKSGLLNLFPAHLRVMEEVMPAARGSGVAEEMGTFIPAKGRKVGTVGLFRGCLMDVMFPETNRKTVDLLTDAGFDVIIPPEQNCCGALHAHSGERELARRMAARNIRVFRDEPVDYIVSNAGGCGALLKEYGHLVGNVKGSEKDSMHDEANDSTSDEALKHAAKSFAAKVKDVSELLIDHLPLQDIGKLSGKRITYQGSCHLRNGMGVEKQPVELLKRIEGAEFVPLYETERCCGSAGIYNLIQPELAGQILQEKMLHVRDTRAHLLVTANPGCLLQMQAGIYRENMNNRMKAVHIVDVLHEARQASRKTGVE